MMNADQEAENVDIKHKTEAVRSAFDKLEAAARVVRVCLDPETGSTDYLSDARRKLDAARRELTAHAESLVTHGVERD